MQRTFRRPVPAGLSIGAAAIALLWSAPGRAATCPSNAIPDCRPCRAPVCDVEGFWYCSAPPMNGKLCNVPVCGNAGTCSNAICNPLPNSKLLITKIGAGGAISDPGSATITVAATSTCQVAGGSVPGGTASQSVEVTPATMYTVSSTQPDGYAVYWGICSGSCTWTPGTSVTVNAPVTGSLEIRFLYRHYTVNRGPLVAAYYRYSGYTKWVIFTCTKQIGEINVQSLDFPSDLPVDGIANLWRDQVRNSPDGWDKCVTPVSTLRAPNPCPDIYHFSNDLGVEATVRIFDDPSFSDPSWFNAVGSYPYPDACELIQGARGAQVCHAQPFPRNTVPKISLPATVTPALSSGFGSCTDMFVQCNERCGSLDFGYVIGDPGLAAWCNSNCNPPGPVTEHWKHVYAASANPPGDERLTTVSGIVGGGKWNDRVCPNGALCKPGAICRFPEISDTDFGPHHLDRDFNFPIIPIKNGAIDGATLNAVDVSRNSGGGLPALDVEIEFRSFYPRQGAATFLYADLFPPAGVLFDTAHASVRVKNQATPPVQFKAGILEGPSFRSPVRSTIGDGWSIDIPTAADQITAKGVLVWDCGHLESDGTPYGGRGFHTELHPVVAAAWLHRPMVDDPQPQARFATLFVKALSHTPYPSGTYQPFDGLSGVFTLGDYDSSLPLCISDPIVDHNAGMQYATTFNRTGEFLGLVDFPKDDPVGYMVAGPDLLVGTAAPKYWNLGVTHLGGGNVRLDLSGNFPGGSDYNITDAKISPEFPLMMGAHVQLCQLATDSSGNVLYNCPGRCAIPPSGTCPFGTGASGGNCVPIAPSEGLVATAVGNYTNAVTVSWNPVPGATGYNVYWGYGASGGTLTAFPGPISSTVISDTRDWGSTFHYVVTALNRGFESAPSNAAVVTLYPAAPPSVTATGGIGQVTVAWAASNGATQYRVYRVDGANNTLVATTTGTSQVVAGLASQTTYSFAVEAWNSTGGSLRSAAASATTSYQCSPTNCSGCCSGNTCNSGYAQCGSVCTNKSSDIYNCGACGVVCTSRQTCTAGACVCKSKLSCPRYYYWDTDICACSQ
jgi:hypothetical protein